MSARTTVRPSPSTDAYRLSVSLLHFLPAKINFRPVGQQLGLTLRQRQCFWVSRNPLPAFDQSVIRQVSRVGANIVPRFWLRSRWFFSTSQRFPAICRPSKIDFSVLGALWMAQDHQWVNLRMPLGLSVQIKTRCLLCRLALEVFDCLQKYLGGAYALRSYFESRKLDHTLSDV